MSSVRPDRLPPGRNCQAGGDDGGCRGGFSCAVGGPARTTLFIVATEWHGTGQMGDEARAGQVVTVEAPAPGTGRP